MSLEINTTVEENLLDDDIFSDPDSDEYSSKEIYIILALELTQLLVCVLALASNIYLIVVISKFKNLQNRINNFIRQYVIFHMLHLVLEILLSIIMELVTPSTFRYDIYCFVSNLDHLLITLCFYVLTFIAVDWYVLNYHLNIYERYPKTFKYGAYYLYALAIPKWITTSTICFAIDWDYSRNIRLHFELASYTVCLLIVIYLTIEAYKTEYAFTLSRIVLLLPFLAYIVRIILIGIESKPGLTRLILYRILNCVENLFLASPIIILCQLPKSNKHFMSAYLKSCKKNRVKNYPDDNLDTDSVNETLPSNVTFNRNSEVINF